MNKKLNQNQYPTSPVNLLGLINTKKKLNFKIYSSKLFFNFATPFESYPKRIYHVVFTDNNISYFAFSLLYSIGDHELDFFLDYQKALFYSKEKFSLFLYKKIDGTSYLKENLKLHDVDEILQLNIELKVKKCSNIIIIKNTCFTNDISKDPLFFWSRNLSIRNNDGVHQNDVKFYISCEIEDLYNWLDIFFYKINVKRNSSLLIIDSFMNDHNGFIQTKPLDFLLLDNMYEINSFYEFNEQIKSNYNAYEEAIIKDL